MRRSVPHEPHDVRMDGVITEAHFFEAGTTVRRTYSPEETHELGRRLAHTLPADSILVLSGPLGCGKTVFVQGLASGMEIDGEIVSQTFTLAKEYHGARGSLWHADLYRLQDSRDVDLAFWSEMLEQPGIKAIEWGERLGASIPLDAIVLKAEIESENERTWTLFTPLSIQNEIHRPVATINEPPNTP